jgi:hypothetical protein
MLHFEPLKIRGEMRCRKMSNVDLRLRKAEHMLYSPSKSFKKDNRYVMIAIALIGIKIFMNLRVGSSHITDRMLYVQDKQSPLI